MVRDQEIIDHILSKWGSVEEMRKLNESYRYTPPYPTLHLEDFLPDQCLHNLYKESQTIPKEFWTTFTRADSYMEERKDLKEAPQARQLVSAMHSPETVSYTHLTLPTKRIV